MCMNPSKELTWDRQIMQNVIRRLFCPKSLVFLCTVKELAVWEGFGSCLVIIAAATITKIVEGFGVISNSLESLSAGIVCGVLLLDMC